MQHTTVMLQRIYANGVKNHGVTHLSAIAQLADPLCFNLKKEKNNHQLHSECLTGYFR